MSTIKEKLTEKVNGVVQGIMAKAAAMAPDAFIPGGTPDPLIKMKNGHIGQAIDRVDGPLKVMGQATYASEYFMENMTYATLLCSTIAKGKILSLETSAAEAAPGVLLVMSFKNAPKMKAPPIFMSAPKAASGTNLPILQDPSIAWNGQPIAVVLAETQEQADFAKTLIKVKYLEEKAILSMEAAKAHKLEQGSFQGEPLKHKKEDAEKSLRESAHRTDATYTTPRHNHNAIEPHATTVSWRDGKLYFHDCSQAVSHVSWTVGQVFGMDEKDVVVTSPFVGGAFGGKALWQYQILAAAASKMIERPVRLALSREDVYRLVGGRTLTEQRVAIGANESSTFTAIIHKAVSAMTEHNNMPEPVINPTKLLYAAESFDLNVETTNIDMLANTFMRAPGEAVGTFALESAVDELAFALQIDPIELRMKNQPDKDPSTDLKFSSRHLIDAYLTGAERFGWYERFLTPGKRREGEWLIGTGVATATYPYFRMPGGAARMKLFQDGRVLVEIAAHDMGMGTATIHAQITADRLGIPLKKVTVNYGDSTLPGEVLAGGSQQTAAVGAAVSAAHRELVKELLSLVGKKSPIHGLSLDDVGGIAAGLCKMSDPSVCESYQSILSEAGKEFIEVSAKAPLPLELSHWSMHSYGAIFCEVRVSEVTGEVRVTRLLGSFDCGKIINPKTAKSQFRGGMIMGVGAALMEETQFDTRKGRIMNANLSDYHVAVQMDVPEIDVIWTDIPDPHTPMGAHGIGEIGITGTAAAVANAVFNATGIRVRDLPLTPDKLLRQM